MSRVVDLDDPSRPLVTSSDLVLKKWTAILFGGILLVTVCGLGVFFGLWLSERGGTDSNTPSPPPPIRNVIYLIADGYGPASTTFARGVARYWDSTPGRGDFLLDRLDKDLIGYHRSRAANSLVTDSAAAATAFSCGVRTNNRYVALDANKNVCGTVMEAAQQQKHMRTGLVATSRITHATPAAFVAHVVHRDSENEIARHEVFSQVDVMLGGGRRHFVPQGTPGGRRTDDWDGVRAAETMGFTYVNDTDGLLGLDVSQGGKVLGLFAMSHMDYEIDRDPVVQPSLKQMTEVALKLLTADDTDDEGPGFMLMVEGSRIDHAAHVSDPVAHYSDIVSFEEAVDVVRAWAEGRDDTLVVKTADHETGGLTLGSEPDIGVELRYEWTADALQDYTVSLTTLTYNFRDIALKNITIDPTVNPTDIIVDLVERIANTTVKDAEVSDVNTGWTMWDEDDEILISAISRIISRAMRLAWSTRGHTGVDIPVYVWGTAAHDWFRTGAMDNTVLGTAVADALGLDLSAVRWSPPPPVTSAPST